MNNNSTCSWMNQFELVQNIDLRKIKPYFSTHFSNSVCQSTEAGCCGNYCIMWVCFGT